MNPLISIIIPSYKRYDKIGKAIEKLIPNKYSYLPNNNYFVNLNKDFGKYNLPRFYKTYKWEEFIWQDKPFGFHIRRVNKKVINGIQVNQKLLKQEEILEAFINKRKFID